MNRVAYNLANRKELQRAVLDKRLYRQKGAETRKLYRAFADWLKQGYFPKLEEREILELGQITCTDRQVVVG